MKKMIERIEREAGVTGLATILADRLPPTDLQSLLLEVYRLRSQRLGPSTVLQNYETDRFVRPSSISPLQLLAWEQIVFSQLPDEFEAIALSPVCPLGTNSVVAPVDQNWAISTARNNEVVSDSSNVIALECAVRRRDLLRSTPKSAQRVHLATSHRLVRAQQYKSPHLSAHFASFVLCSAGRDEGDFRFELAALRLHIGIYLRSLREFLGPHVRLHVTITDFKQSSNQKSLESDLLTPIRDEFESVECEFDNHRTRGRAYYLDFAFLIHASASPDQRIELVDGGSVDWTQKYLSNAKERLVISGLGSERLCQELSEDE